MIHEKIQLFGSDQQRFIKEINDISVNDFKNRKYQILQQDSVTTPIVNNCKQLVILWSLSISRT